jgi:hypothetical protein
MFAPATLTANAQSVTFGSIFKSFLGSVDDRWLSSVMKTIIERYIVFAEAKERGILLASANDIR